jgi:hypothetical protein
MKSVLFVLFCIALFAGCAGVRVRQDYDSSVNFDKLKTYDWLHHEINNTTADSSLTNERVRQAVDDTLAIIGYTRKGSGNVDFLVDYDYNITRTAEASGSTSVGFGFGGGMGGGLGIGVGQTRTRNDEMETLGIAVIDPLTNKLMWRGFIQQEYMRHTDPARLAQLIRKTVEEILTRFPPVKKSEKR